MSGHQSDGALERIAALEARIKELELRQEQADGCDSDGTSGVMSRRRLLTMAGAAAAGAVGAAVLGAEPAGASGTMQYGTSNDAGAAQTSLTSTNTNQTLLLSNSSSSGGALYVSSTGSNPALVVQGLDAATPPLAIHPLDTVGTPSSTPNDVGYLSVDNAGALYVSAFRDPSHIVWIRQTPFIPLASPVRIYDSRSTGGPLTANEDRQIDATAHSSGVPASASAILVNLAIANTVGTGFLGLFKDGISYPGNANINWFGSGQVLSNAATTAVANSAKFKVHCGIGSTQVIIDVIGYYP